MSMPWRPVLQAATLVVAGTELRGDVLYDPSQSALCIVNPVTGEEEVLTVSLLTHGYVAFPGEVFVRDYSEHSGLPAALAVVGLCEEVESVARRAVRLVCDPHAGARLSAVTSDAQRPRGFGHGVSVVRQVN